MRLLDRVALETVEWVAGNMAMFIYFHRACCLFVNGIFSRTLGYNYIRFDSRSAGETRLRIREMRIRNRTGNKQRERVLRISLP